MIMRKVLVRVLAEHDTNGHCKPISITWEDGRIYEIDRILDVRQTASLKCWRPGDTVQMPDHGQGDLSV